ncbi:hypothetical protein Hanom_Chr04g00280991 [Helianthus anomalus]
MRSFECSVLSVLFSLDFSFMNTSTAALSFSSTMVNVWFRPSSRSSLFLL